MSEWMRLFKRITKKTSTLNSEVIQWPHYSRMLVNLLNFFIKILGQESTDSLDSRESPTPNDQKWKFFDSNELYSSEVPPFI